MWHPEPLRLKRKFVVTNSQALSRRIIANHKQIGAEPHSLRTLVRRLSDWLSLSSNNSRQLSSEERMFLGEQIASILSQKNYFATAFKHAGIRHAIFNTLEELRVAGYTPESLSKVKIENQLKLTSLSEIFSLYLEAIHKIGLQDYAENLRELLLRLQNGECDPYLKHVDIVIPFPLAQRGLEVSLIAILREKGMVIESPGGIL